MNKKLFAATIIAASMSAPSFAANNTTDVTKPDLSIPSQSINKYCKKVRQDTFKMWDLALNHNYTIKQAEKMVVGDNKDEMYWEYLDLSIQVYAKYFKKSTIAGPSVKDAMFSAIANSIQMKCEADAYKFTAQTLQAIAERIAKKKGV